MGMNYVIRLRRKTLRDSATQRQCDCRQERDEWQPNPSRGTEGLSEAPGRQPGGRRVPVREEANSFAVRITEFWVVRKYDVDVVTTACEAADDGLNEGRCGVAWLLRVAQSDGQDAHNYQPAAFTRANTRKS
jgi:hypothetical protein